jgi:hypothetical protein
MMKSTFGIEASCQRSTKLSNMTVRSPDGQRDLQLNRFTLMSRLGQYYILDNMSRMLDMRLDQYRDHKYHGDLNREYDSGETSKSFLSSSYFGGARYLKNNAQDALTIVSEKGHPTWFITVTVNPKWEVRVHKRRASNTRCHYLFCTILFRK